MTDQSERMVTFCFLGLKKYFVFHILVGLADFGDKGQKTTPTRKLPIVFNINYHRYL